MAQTKDGAIKLSAKKNNLSIEEYLKKILNEKKCYKCKEWKLINDFGIDNSRHDKLCPKCNSCRWTNGGKRGGNRKGCISPMKGKKITGQALENIRAAAKITGKKRIGTKKIYTKQGYENLIKAVSKPRPNFQGEKNHNWKGGSAMKKGKDYNSPRYRAWRKAVFERDGYTCQDKIKGCCIDNGKGGNLEAHHLKEYSKFIELRYEVSNGITLCKNCHRLRHFNPNSVRNKKNGE